MMNSDDEIERILGVSEYKEGNEFEQVINDIGDGSKEVKIRFKDDSPDSMRSEIPGTQSKKMYSVIEGARPFQKDTSSNNYRTMNIDGINVFNEQHPNNDQMSYDSLGNVKGEIFQNVNGSNSYMQAYSYRNSSPINKFKDDKGNSAIDFNCSQDSIIGRNSTKDYQYRQNKEENDDFSLEEILGIENSKLAKMTVSKVDKLFPSQGRVVSAQSPNQILTGESQQANKSMDKNISKSSNSEQSFDFSMYSRPGFDSQAHEESNRNYFKSYDEMQIRRDFDRSYGNKDSYLLNDNVITGEPEKSIYRNNSAISPDVFSRFDNYGNRTTDMDDSYTLTPNSMNKKCVFANKSRFYNGNSMNKETPYQPVSCPSDANDLYNSRPYDRSPAFCDRYVDRNSQLSNREESYMNNGSQSSGPMLYSELKKPKMRDSNTDPLLFRNPVFFQYNFNPNAYNRVKRRRKLNSNTCIYTGGKMMHPSQLSSIDYVFGSLNSETQGGYGSNEYYDSPLGMLSPDKGKGEATRSTESFKKKVNSIDFDNITVLELKSLMKNFGVNPNGKKQEMIERLQRKLKELEPDTSSSAQIPKPKDSGSFDGFFF